MNVTYFERAPGVWRIRIETGRTAPTDDNPAGERKFSYETVRGTEEAAQRRRFELMAAHEDGSFAAPEKLTLAAYLAQWVKTREAIGKIRRSSAENYQEIFRSYVNPTLGSRRLQKLTGIEIQNLYTELLGRGLSTTTVAQVHAILSPAFKSARRSRLIKINPLEEVDAPKRKKSIPKAANEEQRHVIFRELSGKYFERPVLLSIASGLRRGEICGLRKIDLRDLDRRKLHVAGQVVRYRDGTIEWKEPKSEKSIRSMTLPAETVDMLRTHMVEMSAQRIRLGLGAWRDDDFIFTKDGVNPINPNTLSTDVNNFLDKIGFDRLTLHSARHTHATVLLKKVGRSGAKAVSERLGHNKLVTTLEIYQTVFEEDDEELGDLAGEIFGPSGMKP